MPFAWHYIYHALAAYHLLPCVHMLGVPSRESLENTVYMNQKILEASFLSACGVCSNSNQCCSLNTGGAECSD